MIPIHEYLHVLLSFCLFFSPPQQAIIAKKLIAPEIYDLIKEVSQILVQNYSPTGMHNILRCCGSFDHGLWHLRAYTRAYMHVRVRMRVYV